jgi:hypothetical protein
MERKRRSAVRLRSKQINISMLVAWNVLNDIKNVVWQLVDLLLGHERKEAHTTPTKKEQRHQQTY